MNLRVRLTLTAFGATCLVFAESVVRVENATGNITVRVVASGEDVRLESSSPAREVRADDIQFARDGELVTVRCQPGDGARIDLDLTVRANVGRDAHTRSGTISFSGFLRQVRITTESGDVKLAVSRRAMIVVAFSQGKPKRQSLPRGTRFAQESGQWVLRDTDRSEPAFGVILVKAASLGQFALTGTPLPVGIEIPYYSIVRDTAGALARMNELRKPRSKGSAASQGRAGRTLSAGLEGVPLFRSDVRLASFSAAVHDREGHPVPGLGPLDFEVLEDGIAQKVASARAEEIPFNLAVLLDLSGSTLGSRAAIKEVARRFIDVAQPRDRIAVYGLASALFHVISRLTVDRRDLLGLIQSIPPLEGGPTPLYGCILLSYLEEFYERPQERNALIVVSDGLDLGVGAGMPPAARNDRARSVPPPPSGSSIALPTGVAENSAVTYQAAAWNSRQVSFEQLRRYAAEVNVMTYPVLLDRGNSTARKNMQALADATGGRLFQAGSLQNLEPVYAQVSDELRSVYTVSYYPGNQNFDGKWRRVEVRVKRPGATLRSRPGYYAR